MLSTPLALVKAIHVMGILFWIGGLLHAGGLAPGRAAPILRKAAHPGMVITVLSGFVLAFWTGALSGGLWLWLKLLLVIFLLPLTYTLLRTADLENPEGEGPLAPAKIRALIHLIVLAILYLVYRKI